MKVTGPGSPPAPPEGASGNARDADAVRGKGGAQGPTEAGRTFAEAVSGAPPPTRGAPEASGRAAATGGADPLTADIAADLEAGKIDPKAALDRVVERVLDQQ